MSNLRFGLAPAGFQREWRHSFPRGGLLQGTLHRVPHEVQTHLVPQHNSLWEMLRTNAIGASFLSVGSYLHPPLAIGLLGGGALLMLWRRLFPVSRMQSIPGWAGGAAHSIRRHPAAAAMACTLLAFVHPLAGVAAGVSWALSQMVAGVTRDRQLGY